MLWAIFRMNDSGKIEMDSRDVVHSDTSSEIGGKLCAQRVPDKSYEHKGTHERPSFKRITFLAWAVAQGQEVHDLTDEYYGTTDLKESPVFAV
ncbi:hypothetical protein K0M31_016023 [Melipona bicolor]|uniref:Uncharacterized protein n=1 Tax=Melipona bicolor TaxID=60889 RepID=A0AA40G6A0_9HYME|nr:hypothetical protein K0M31_016023 [Melipona bicolor]